ncbi:MAG: MoaD/ThiS family protein [Rhizobiaceae bacterium]
MVEVNLWLGLRDLADGNDKVEVEAKNIGELLQQLVENYPRLEPVIEAGVSVAVDGRLIFNDLTEPINEDSEVYLLQQLKGG